jgi:glyoxylase-like metal-dependent hydrolase (beta-lactamase superfamily II)
MSLHMSRDRDRINRRDVLKLAGGAATLAAFGTVPSAVQAAAPMHGVLRPEIYRFKLGAFEVTNILDGIVQRPPHPTFGGNQPAAMVEELAKANGVPGNNYEQTYVNTIVNTGRELVLFDTGNGKGRNPAVGRLTELMDKAGYKPEQIDVVVITHGHPDHIGGLMSGDKPTFANARTIFGEAEFDFWRKGENVREARKANREQFVKLAVPLGEKATFVKTESEVVPGIRSVPSFGHSPGHMAYHVESNGQRLLIWGDVANHYIFAVQRPDWPGSFDDNPDAAVASRKLVLDMAATERFAVTGYHMPFPALGFIEKSGASYRWVPATYQFNL